jgi:hypothetical protein
MCFWFSRNLWCDWLCPFHQSLHRPALPQSDIYVPCYARDFSLRNIHRYRLYLYRVRVRVTLRLWSCGICGGQSGTGAGFLRVLRFPLPIFIPPIARQSSSSIIWGLYNRSEVAAVPRDLVPLHKNKKKLRLAVYCESVRLSENPLRHMTRLFFTEPLW